jgi:hypothetical protein
MPASQEKIPSADDWWTIDYTWFNVQLRPLTTQVIVSAVLQTLGFPSRNI